MAILADTGRIRPLGEFVRWYQEVSGVKTIGIAFGFLRTGEIWASFFISLVFACALGLIAARLRDPPKLGHRGILAQYDCRAGDFRSAGHDPRYDMGAWAAVARSTDWPSGHRRELHDRRRRDGAFAVQVKCSWYRQLWRRQRASGLTQRVQSTPEAS